MSKQVKSKKLNIVEGFNRLPDNQKIKFTFESLEAFKKVMANPKAKAKLLKQIIGLFLSNKQQLNPQHIMTLQQMLVCFLFSLKPEFMYDWAEIIDLTVGHPLPPHFEERKKQVKSLKWFHIGLPTNLWKETNQKMNELGSVENFFKEAVEALSKPKPKKPKKRKSKT